MGKILYVNGQQTYVETRVPQQTEICPITKPAAQRETHFITGSGRHVYRPELVAERLYQSGMFPVQAWIVAQTLINRDDGLVDPQSYFDETAAMKFANFIAGGFFGTADYRDFHLAEVLREAGIEGDPAAPWQKLENLNPANHNEALHTTRYALLQLAHPVVPASKKKFPKEQFEKTPLPSSDIEVAEATAVVVFTALIDLDVHKVEFDLLSRNLRGTLTAAELAQLESDLKMVNDLSRELKGYFARGTYNNLPIEVRDLLEKSSWVADLVRTKDTLRDALARKQGIPEAVRLFADSLNFARLLLSHSMGFANGRSGSNSVMEVERLTALLSNRAAPAAQAAATGTRTVVGELGDREVDLRAVRDAVRRAQETAMALGDTFTMAGPETRAFAQITEEAVVPAAAELAAAKAETPAVVAATAGTPPGLLKISALILFSAAAGLGVTYWLKHRNDEE